MACKGGLRKEASFFGEKATEERIKKDRDVPGTVFRRTPITWLGARSVTSS